MQIPDIKYYKDFKHNYLVIADSDQLARNIYRVKMITENQISGLLSCQERHINGETLLYYDITSKQNISRLYDNQSFNILEMRNLFIQLKLVSDLLQKYLLHESGLLLQPEYIYKDLNREKYVFLYYPGMDTDSMSQLMDFLLNKVDNDDEIAVETIYKVADLVQNGQTGIDEIVTWFPSEEKEPQKNLYENDPCKIEINEVIPAIEQQFSKEDNNIEKVSLLKRIICKVFHIELSHPSAQHVTPTYRETMETEAKQNKENTDSTVFIPWTEYCENKLYGISRGNKYHINLDKLPITVGKMIGAVDMVINEQSISRMHVRFAKENGHIIMTDLNSTNGTFRNGLRLEPNDTEIIEPGDEIKLGKLKFIYR